MVRRVKEERDWGVKLILPLKYKDAASLNVFINFVVLIVSLDMLELFYRFKLWLRIYITENYKLETQQLYNHNKKIRM